MLRTLGGARCAGAIPQLPISICADLCPVDWVADAVTAFALSRHCGTYNLTAATQTPMNFLLEQLKSVIETDGEQLARLPLRAWHSRLVASVEDSVATTPASPHPVAAVLDFFR